MIADRLRGKTGASGAGDATIACCLTRHRNKSLPSGDVDAPAAKAGMALEALLWAAPRAANSVRIGARSISLGKHRVGYTSALRARPTRGPVPKHVCVWWTDLVRHRWVQPSSPSNTHLVRRANVVQA